MEFMMPSVVRWRTLWLAALCLCLGRELANGTTLKNLVINGNPVALVEVTNGLQVRFTAMRYNRAQNVWNVDVALVNTGTNPIFAPLVLLVSDFQGTTGLLNADGNDDDIPPKPFLDLSSRMTNAVLSPGTQTTPRTLSFGYTANMSPRLVTRMYVNPVETTYALGLTRSLNVAGQPLAGVTVVESGPQAILTNRTDPVFGVVTLGQAQGMHSWKFLADDYLPVWRQQVLTNGMVRTLPNPRLTPRDTNRFAFTSGAVCLASNDAAGVYIQFSPGSFANGVTAALTPLTGQTLPAMLPLGWSPLQAFWFELEDSTSHASVTPSQVGTVSLLTWAKTEPTETVALVRWQEAALQWQVVDIVPGTGTNILVMHCLDGGAYAVVVGDGGAGAPPLPKTGQTLVASTASLPDTTTLKAGGQVVPAVSLASLIPELVTARAEVVVTNPSGTLPSGLLLRCEVGERYQLRDGSLRVLPHYESFIVGYQRPGDATLATLHAAFPLRPVLLFGAEELEQATITVDILPPTPFAGGVLDTNGGQAGAITRVTANAGDISGIQAAQVRDLDQLDFAGLATTGVSIERAFDLSVAGVAPARRLLVQGDSLSTNSYFVAARVIGHSGVYGLEPVERLQSDATGKLSSLEPAVGGKLPGITGAGQYVLAKVSGPQGLISGTARNSSGQAVSGQLMRITGLPWLTFSAADGSYQLIAPTGAVEIAITDLINGNNGWTNVVVTNLLGVQVDLGSVPTGPRVVEVTPAAEAQAVSRVTPIVVHFSKPINPGTLVGNGIQLVDTNGQPQAASVTLNLRNTMVTLLPTSQLAASTRYTIQLAKSIADAGGLPLVGPNTFAFTTASDTLNRVAQVICYEPTNGLTRIVGGAGIAEPNAPVILVNETSGQTATVLSKPDGSFDNFLQATVDDYLSAVIVNQNGTRNTIPASRQLYRDGSVGLYNGGGILEAQSDGMPVQVIVEPGAIPGKTKFSLDGVPMVELLTLLQNTLPTNGTLLAGFRFRSEGDSLQTATKVGLTISEENLGVPVNGSPDDFSYALAIPRVVDGVVVYQMVDHMHYSNGKLVTASPPYPGLRNQGLVGKPVDPAGPQPLPAPAPVSGKKPGSKGLNDYASVGTAITATIVKYANITISVEGYVYSAERLASGAFDQTTRRALRSATVFGVPPGTGNTGGLGRVPAGALTAVTDESGFFAFIINGAWIANDSFALRSRSAFFPGQLANGVATLAGTMVYRAGGTVYFERGGQVAAQPDLVPPVLRMSHQPNLPGVGQEITFTAFATDNRDVPTLTVTVDQETPLVAGGNPSTNDVTLIKTNEQVTGLSISQQYSIRARAAATVTLAVNAIDPSGNANFARYRLLVGVAGQPVPGASVATNGPYVLNSDPPHGVVDFNPHSPIVIRFDKPVHDRVLADLVNSITLSPDAGVPNGRFNSNQTELSLWFPNLAEDTDYSMVCGNGITDLLGNPFDQEPETKYTFETYNISFHTRKLGTRSLTSMNNGGGVAGDTNYLFALDRKGPTGDTGWLVVYRRTNDTCTYLSRLQLPSYPRDLVYIPRYSFYNEQMTKTTADFVAVAGGLVGDTGQWLAIVNVSDPTKPSIYVATYLTKSPSAAVVKLARSGVRLGYLEFEPGADSVGVIDLQLLLYAYRLPTLANQPVDGREGLDKNGNGDYVDTGDIMPLPRRMSGRPATVAEAALVGQFTLGENSVQHITDFGMGLNGRFIGVTHGADANSGSGYHTLAVNGTPLDPSQGFLAFSNQPDRMTTLFGVLLQQDGGGSRYANLALVSGGTAGMLSVVEITDALNPSNLVNIPVPSDSGAPRSATVTPTGWVLLAGTRDMILIDPTRFLLSPQNGIYPAVVAIVRGVGSSVRSFVADETGFAAVCEGGRDLFAASPQPDPANFQPSGIVVTEFKNDGTNTIVRQGTNYLEIVALAPQETCFQVLHDPANYTPPAAWPDWLLDGGQAKRGRAVYYNVPGAAASSSQWYLPLSLPTTHYASAGAAGQRASVVVYPDIKREIKVMGTDFLDKIHEAQVAMTVAVAALRASPIQIDPPELVGPSGMLTFAHQWKECPTANTVSLAFDLNSQFDPLLGVKMKVGYGFVFPPPLTRYLIARVYVEAFAKLKARGTVSRNECGQFSGTVAVEVEGGLAAGVEAVAGAAFEAAVYGESKLSGSGELAPGPDDLGLNNVQVASPGLNGKITIKALGGWLEYEHEIPILSGSTIYQKDHLVLKAYQGITP